MWTWSVIKNHRLWACWLRETDSRRREKLSRRKPPKFNLFYSCTSVNLEHIYIFYVKFSLSRIHSKVAHDVFPTLCSVTNCWMVSLGQQKWLVSLFAFWSNFAVVTTNSRKSLFYADTGIFLFVHSHFVQIRWSPLFLLASLKSYWHKFPVWEHPL